MIRQLREWARGHTERGRYSPVGIAFHWIMAFLILFPVSYTHLTLPTTPYV